MIPAFVSQISILGAQSLLAEFALVGHVEMFSMGTFNMILHSVGLNAKLSADHTHIPRSSVVADKV